MVGNDRAVASAEHVCLSCHGLDGRSSNPTFPNLAGQQTEYLEVELQACRGKTRADPHARTYMFGMAAKLDDSTIKGIAAFHAAQRPASAAGDANPGQLRKGGEIFRNAIAAENRQACAACHGDKAEDAGAVPRLADQHPRYIVEQLQAFRQNARANGIMHENTREMTDAQMRSVAAVLASL